MGAAGRRAAVAPQGLDPAGVPWSTLHACCPLRRGGWSQRGSRDFKATPPVVARCRLCYTLPRLWEGPGSQGSLPTWFLLATEELRVPAHAVTDLL